MPNLKVVYPNFIVVSASVIRFEIISTRILSIIFVNNYAIIILLLAILGLGRGGTFSYYKIKKYLLIFLNIFMNISERITTRFFLTSKSLILFEGK